MRTGETLVRASLGVTSKIIIVPHGHMRADLRAIDLRSHRDDLPGELVPRHDRVRSRRELTLGDVHVGAAHAACPDPDHHLAAARLGIRALLDAQHRQHVPESLPTLG